MGLSTIKMEKRSHLTITWKLFFCVHGLGFEHPRYRYKKCAYKESFSFTEYANTFLALEKIATAIIQNLPRY